MIKSIEDHREPGSEPYSREDMVLMLSERIDANINYSYEQLETTLSEHIQDFQDFMEGASSADVAEVPGTPEPSLAEAEAEADAKFDIEGSPPEAIGSLSPGERKGRHRRRSSLLRALEQSLTPTATGRIVAKTGDSPGTVSSSSVLQALEKFSPGAEEMLCNDIVASPLASSLRDSVSEMGSAGRAIVGMLRASGEVPLSPVVSAGETLKLEEQLEQLRKENQRLENCYKESARDLEEERRLNGSLQEQLQAAQVGVKEASSSKNDQALAGEPSEHLEAAQVSKGDQDHQGDPELNVCQSPEPETCHL